LGLVSMTNDMNDCFLSICSSNMRDLAGLYLPSQRLLSESSMKGIVASILGSTASTLLLNPLSVVKIQLQHALSKLPSSRTMSIGSTITQIYQQSGYRGFYSGVGVSLLQTLPSTVIYMSSYEQIKTRLTSSSVISSSSSLHSIHPAIAGGLARLFTVSIMAPVELIRTIRTAGSSQKPIAIAQSMLRTRGVSGLYAGWASTVLRDTPYSMIYWLSYERFRQLFSSRSVDSQLAYFIAGSFAGLIAAVITHPFDVLKTQRQLEVNSSPAGEVGSDLVAAVEGRSSMIKRMVSLVTDRGLPSLYRGLSMRLMTVIPSGAIMVTVYETVKNYDRN
jgi:solute carrier family 25, member 39/40